MNVNIRWMIRRDTTEVINIERASYEYPWTAEELLEILRHRNAIGMVAEHDFDVVGFMVYELHKKKLHMLNFAVHPDYRRMGVGTQMVQKLIGKLSTQRRRDITLHVRETNLAGQLFFQSQGFYAVDIIREFYEEHDESAYAMRYRVDEMPPQKVYRNRITKYVTDIYDDI